MSAARPGRLKTSGPRAAGLMALTYARFSWHDAGHVSLAISPRRRRRRRRIAGSAAADAEVGQDPAAGAGPLIQTARRDRRRDGRAGPREQTAQHQARQQVQGSATRPPSRCPGNSPRHLVCPCLASLPTRAAEPRRRRTQACRMPAATATCNRRSSRSRLLCGTARQQVRVEFALPRLAGPARAGTCGTISSRSPGAVRASAESGQLRAGAKLSSLSRRRGT